MKNDKVLMSTKSKLNSIKTISQALIDIEISHKESIAIFKENKNLGSENDMRLSSIKSKT